MTPEQRYLLDTMGYLHLKNVLNTEELEHLQDAAERLVNTPPEKLPVGVYKQKGNPVIDSSQDKYRRGVTFDRAFEHLTMHPATWPIIKELTGNKPCLCRGNLMVNTHKHTPIPLHNGDGGQMLALGVNRNGKNSPRGFGEPGTLFCELFSIFWYLTDVYPGDGGLLLTPGSHKSEFESPYARVFDSEENLPQGVVNVMPKAGDAVVIPEVSSRGSLKWKPKDRERRFVICRYVPQHILAWHRDTDYIMIKEMKDRLAPETQELVETTWRTHEKKITKRDTIRLI